MSTVTPATITNITEETVNNISIDSKMFDYILKLPQFDPKCDIELDYKIIYNSDAAESVFDVHTIFTPPATRFVSFFEENYQEILKYQDYAFFMEYIPERVIYSKDGAYPEFTHNIKFTIEEYYPTNVNAFRILTLTIDYDETLDMDDEAKTLYNKLIKLCEDYCETSIDEISKGIFGYL